MALACDGQREIKVTVELRPRGSATEVMVTHEQLPEREAASHVEGWADGLALLASLCVETAMLLADKVAVIYGRGGGAIGGAVAREVAREGARVFLAGPTRAKLERAAADIAAAGGHAEVAVVDALDEAAVVAHADAVAARTGRIDVALHAVGIVHVQGTTFTRILAGELAPSGAMTGAIANLSCGAVLD